MSTDYNFIRVVRTDAPQLVVMEAVRDAIGPLGGTLTTNDEKGIIKLVDGKIGIFGDFMFDCSARFVVKRKEEGKYTIDCSVRKDPNSIFWLILIGGLCAGLWPAWFLNIYYLFIDLGKEYQKKLENVDSYL
ncbi:MAG: hypothetical protein JXA22_08585 [Candidatus Thermoplasmatota archaeon]|nr:hypothetical protein [Candidatus Thermoplasmatota archaeon]